MKMSQSATTNARSINDWIAEVSDALQEQGLRHADYSVDNHHASRLTLYAYVTITSPNAGVNVNRLEREVDGYVANVTYVGDGVRIQAVSER